MVDSEWPNWNEPATKGEVILAMVNIRACTSKLIAALVNQRAGDQEKTDIAINAYFAADEEFAKLIERIGGSENA